MVDDDKRPLSTNFLRRYGVKLTVLVFWLLIIGSISISRYLRKREGRVT